MTQEAVDWDPLPGRQEMITDPLTHFMRCRSELAEFVTLYHKMAAQAFHWEKPGYDQDLHKEYLGQSIYFLENYLLRFDGIVDIYVEEAVAELAFAVPDFLSGAEIEKSKRRLVKRGVLDPDDSLAVNEAAKFIARASKQELADSVRSRCGIDLRLDKFGWSEVLLLGSIRDIIVHNSSEVDHRFKLFCDSIGYKSCGSVGEMFLIPENEVMRIVSTADEWVWALDAEVSKYPNVFTRSRYGHFWLPRSQWGREKLLERLEA